MHTMEDKWGFISHFKTVLIYDKERMENWPYLAVYKISRILNIYIVLKIYLYLVGKKIYILIKEMENSHKTRDQLKISLIDEETSIKPVKIFNLFLP